MSTVTSKPEAVAGALTEKEKWLRAYRQMVRIRLFEEQVNELYLTQLMQTHDAREGLKAFLEKRKPNWKNR